ncbi:MAG: type 4a pilus biogenesis protein PilO [Vicinamibacterales bacterium]|jgi:type IV pilus assembly protein PilO|nr:type 4a pilus biogenesis protein PilO [Vicinamibacterales bacterium]
MELGLNKLPWSGQIGAFLLVAIALFAVFRIYYIGPRLEEQAQKQVELEQKLAEVEQAQQDAIELAEFQAEVDDLNNRLEALSAVLPEQEEVAGLLRRLVTFAQQSNLTIQAFRPQAAVMREMHAEWPIQLELEGTYHNLGMFFDRVSKFSRIINVSDVVIRVREPAELNLTITAECTATTFVLLEPPEAEPAPAT